MILVSLSVSAAFGFGIRQNFVEFGTFREIALVRMDFSGILVFLVF